MTCDEYKEHINSTYNKDGKHIVRHFSNDGTMTNAGKTGDRDADKGGHLWITGSGNVPGGRYITPLCPECNAKRGQQIPVKKNSVFFKELGAKFEDKN